MDDEQRTLILRAQQGDQWAFEKLISHYDRRVLNMARDMVGNAEDAQDIYQEALMAAYRGLPKFRMESDFSTWLYRIAVNKALKFRRRRGAVVDLEALPADFQRDDATPEKHTLEREFHRQLQQALEALSKKERMAFALCHQQGLKIAEAAALMDCSTGAVKSYLFRGREKVKRSLGKYLDE